MFLKVYVIGFENIRIHPSTRYRIRCRIIFFHSVELSGFAVEFAGCVWTIAVSGKKKLWIQKYPDTCRQDLNQVRLILFGAVEAIFTRASFGQSTNYGQMDRQIVASGRKLNLRRDLRWVAKRTRKFPHKYTQIAWQSRLSSFSLGNGRLMDVTQLALTCVDLGWVAKRWRTALTCLQIWSPSKWAQVIASQRTCTQGLAKRSRV